MLCHRHWCPLMKKIPDLGPRPEGSQGFKGPLCPGSCSCFLLSSDLWKILAERFIPFPFSLPSSPSLPSSSFLSFHPYYILFLSLSVQAPGCTPTCYRFSSRELQLETSQLVAQIVMGYLGITGLASPLLIISFRFSIFLSVHILPCLSLTCLVVSFKGHFKGSKSIFMHRY